jgi:hypothetical protein
MILINTATLKLEEHIQIVPGYAILSHTWGDEEVSFQEWLTLGTYDELLSLLNELEKETIGHGTYQDWLLATRVTSQDSASAVPNYSSRSPNRDSRLNRFGYWKILKACVQA